jgi:hypothetical protein
LTPYKDPVKQRKAVKEIMKRRYSVYNGFENGTPFYVTVRRIYDKMVEFGVTHEDLSTPEKLATYFNKLRKMGSFPTEIWYCYPIWLSEETPSKREIEPTAPLTNAVAKRADLPLPSETESAKRKRKRKDG